MRLVPCHIPIIKHNSPSSSPDPKVATHAMSTLRTLLNSNSWLATHDEQLVQKKRVMEGGIIPKLLTVCKRVKEANPLRECLRLLAQMGMEPTSLEEGDVKGICPVLMDLAGYEDSRVSYLKLLMNYTPRKGLMFRCSPGNVLWKP